MSTFNSLDEALDREDYKQNLEWIRDQLAATTDAGNAGRFADRERHRFLFTEDRGWMLHDGVRFVRDATNQARRAFVKMVRNDLAEATKRALLIQWQEDSPAIKTMVGKIQAHQRASENNRGILNGLAVAADNSLLRAADEDLDAHPFLLNCTNGTLDLRTLELRPHDPADRITKVTAGRYDPEAKAPNFRAFVERFLPDKEVRAFVQRYLGAALLGQRQEIIAYMYGAGANSKSTLMQAVRTATGDYATDLDPDVFVARRGRASVADKELVAVLQGARLAWGDEIDAGNQLAEAQIKWLTNPTITTQRKYEHPFTFTNEASTVITANHRLAVRGTDDGIWRRLALVPFDVQLPESERDPTYFGRVIRPELDGVLAWLVEGLSDYYEHGHRLDPPAAVQAATAKWRAEQDLLAQWLDEEVEHDDEALTTRRALWASFDKYATREAGMPPLSRPEFYERFEKLTGLRLQRPRDDGSRQRGYAGIRLKDAPGFMPET